MKVVCNNDLLAEPNALDAAKFKLDEERLQLSDAFKSIDVAKIDAAL